MPNKGTVSSNRNMRVNKSFGAQFRQTREPNEVKTFQKLEPFWCTVVLIWKNILFGLPQNSANRRQVASRHIPIETLTQTHYPLIWTEVSLFLFSPDGITVDIRFRSDRSARWDSERHNFPGLATKTIVFCLFFCNWPCAWTAVPKATSVQGQWDLKTLWPSPLQRS